ncbi:hypothetical protein JO388_11030, partial [Streptococcus suis]|uniref:hypothetical protein n=1 Tax=Streptococcus suis TaxID=1307 RepID=UPI00195F71ED
TAIKPPTPIRNRAFTLFNIAYSFISDRHIISRLAWRFYHTKNMNNYKLYSVKIKNSKPEPIQ